MNVAFPTTRGTTFAVRRAPVRLRVAFGPETLGWGSWNWVGADLQRELTGCFHTVRFGWHECPECDVAVVVKHLPPADLFEKLARRSMVVYAPVDFYAGAADIAADAASLELCARIVVHCERLAAHFEPYAPVSYMDHHVKFASREMGAWRGVGRGGKEGRGRESGLQMRNVKCKMQIVGGSRREADASTPTSLDDPPEG